MNKLVVIALVVVFASSSVFAAVVNVGPPTGDDYEVLQSAVDDNPHAVLKLQPGTYDIGANTLVVPHGITIRGSHFRKGRWLTTVQGSQTVIHVRAVEANAQDHIKLRDLRISTNMEAPLMESRAAILHQPADEYGTWFPGGGNLTIANCDVYAAASYTIVAEATDGVDLKIVNSVVETGTWDAIVLLNITNRRAIIRNNRITAPHDGVETWDRPTWLPWQNPQESSRVWIVGNEIEAATRPAPWPVQMGIDLLPSRGSYYVINNVINLPGSELPGHGSVGINWQPQPDVEGASLHALANQVAGGETNDGKYRGALQTFGSNTRWVGNEISGHFSTGMITGLPKLGVFFGSSNNHFVGTDFSEAVITQDSTFLFPALHWWFDTRSSDNSVTSFGETEQLVLDEGVNNEFRGDGLIMQ